MVFRKPYAFLIKNFKIIHLILFGLMTWFFLKIRNIVSFLNDYIDKKTYSQITGVVDEYFGSWTVLLPLLIIGIIIAIIALLKQKKKPIKYYVFALITIIIQIVLISLTRSVFNDIQMGEATSVFTQVICDLSSVLSLLIIPFALIALIRAVGFNVKQFNFKKDLIELDINESDREEVEFEVEVDTENVMARLNRRLRFIKYVYLENKVIFWCVGGLCVFGIILSIVLYIASIEKIYSENESFKVGVMELKVTNSYKTKYSYNGNQIRSDKFYVAVKLDAKNLSNKEVNIPYKYLYLKVADGVKYIPTDNYVNEFSDLGNRYISSDKVKAKEERQILLLYEVDLEYEKNKMQFEYLVSKTDSDKDSVFDTTKVKLKPVEFAGTTTVDEKELKENLSFDNSLLAGTELEIDEVEFNNRYSYTYKQTIGSLEKEFTKSIIPTDTSRYSKTIMRIKANLKKNDKLDHRVYSSLYTKFATIEYNIDGKAKRQPVNVIDVTPSSNMEYTYLEVLEEVSKATKVSLVFNIRDKEYKYKLVG